MKLYKIGLLICLLFMGQVYPQSVSKSDRLTKLGLSQLIFAGIGALDYSIKEAPMYPSHRPDTFFWRTGWAGITYGTAFSINLLAVKEPKLLIGALTEDMSYYLCRKIFHKEDFPEKFGLPMRIFGADHVPMRTMIIIWVASLTYLLLDALDIL
jgi:hypothetical protein